MKLTDINLREKEFHNKLQSQKDERFENRFYKAIHNIGDDFLAFLKNNVKDKEVLDYGCGIGTSAEKVSKFSPNRITGIDISEISINKADNLISLKDAYGSSDMKYSQLDPEMHKPLGEFTSDFSNSFEYGYSYLNKSSDYQSLKV